jgi:hypothetical protein
MDYPTGTGFAFKQNMAIITVKYWTVEWHSLMDRAMKSDFYAAETIEEAIEQAKVEHPRMCECFRQAGPPIDPSSEQGKRMGGRFDHSITTKGRAAVRAKGYRM